MKKSIIYLFVLPIILFSSCSAIHFVPQANEKQTSHFDNGKKWITSDLDSTNILATAEFIYIGSKLVMSFPLTLENKGYNRVDFIPSECVSFIGTNEKGQKKELSISTPLQVQKRFNKQAGWTAVGNIILPSSNVIERVIDNANTEKKINTIAQNAQNTNGVMIKESTFSKGEKLQGVIIAEINWFYCTSMELKVKIGKETHIFNFKQEQLK
jgi:hypothetical protein